MIEIGYWTGDVPKSIVMLSRSEASLVPKAELLRCAGGLTQDHKRFSFTRPSPIARALGPGKAKGCPRALGRFDPNVPTVALNNLFD